MSAAGSYTFPAPGRMSLHPEQLQLHPEQLQLQQTHAVACTKHGTNPLPVGLSGFVMSSARIVTPCAADRDAAAASCSDSRCPSVRYTGTGTTPLRACA